MTFTNVVETDSYNSVCCMLYDV